MLGRILSEQTTTNDPLRAPGVSQFEQLCIMSSCATHEARHAGTQRHRCRFHRSMKISVFRFRHDH